MSPSERETVTRSAMRHLAVAFRMLKRADREPALRLRIVHAYERLRKEAELVGTQVKRRPVVSHRWGNEEVRP